MKLSDVAKIVNGELIGADAHFYGASTDTRLIEAGQIFFAWKGECHDAHDFLETIEAKGAIAAVVERFVSSANISQIVVRDSQKALGILAKAWRKRWDGVCVGLTGSNGKTTVKEMIASIFSQVDQTLATKGNLNNHVGCPLTLLRLNEQYRFAVIEMGANHPKEISYLTKITQPNIALLNNAGACHLEGFGSLEGVAKAKAEIFEGLASDGGIAVINADDPYFSYWYNIVKDKKIITFGIQNSADVYASDISGSSFTLHYEEVSLRVHLQLEGLHNILNACAASAVALSAGISMDVVKNGLEQLVPVEGRLQKMILTKNIILINDGYNANPNSLKAGMDALDTHLERWLILGDMKELGEKAIALHEECGHYAREKGISRLIAIGELACYSSKAFGTQGECFTSKEALLSFLRQQLASYGKNKQLTILVKGSNSMNMQFFIDQLIKE